VPAGWRIVERFHVDLEVADCDTQGWMYQLSLLHLNADFAKSATKATEKPRHVFRRRRWCQIIEMEETDSDDSDPARILPHVQGVYHEGWLGIRSISKNRLGKHSWKSRYAMLWEGSLRNRSIPPEADDAESDEPGLNIEVMADDSFISLPEDGLHGSKNTKGSRLKATYRRQKEKISHLGKNKHLRLEGNVGNDPIWMYLKSMNPKFFMSSSQVANMVQQMDRDKDMMGSNKGVKNQCLRWFVLGSGCVIDDTLATPQQPGFFAVHYNKRHMQVLNAYSEEARLRWVAALREVLAKANPDAKLTAVVKTLPGQKRLAKKTGAPAPLKLGSTRKLLPGSSKSKASAIPLVSSSSFDGAIPVRASYANDGLLHSRSTSASPRLLASDPDMGSLVELPLSQSSASSKTRLALLGRKLKTPFSKMGNNSSSLGIEAGKKRVRHPMLQRSKSTIERSALKMDEEDMSNDDLMSARMPSSVLRQAKSRAGLVLNSLDLANSESDADTNSFHSNNLDNDSPSFSTTEFCESLGAVLHETAEGWISVERIVDADSVFNTGDIIKSACGILLSSVSDLREVLASVDDCSDIEMEVLRDIDRKSKDEKLLDIHSVFEQLIPESFAQQKLLAYSILRHSICSRLGMNPVDADAVEVRRWFTKQLDEFFRKRGDNYRVVGLDMDENGDPDPCVSSII